MQHSNCAQTVLLLFALASGAAAQLTVPAPAPAPPAPAAPRLWKYGPFNFSGFLDGYYSLNFNHPSSAINGFRNFDVTANRFALSMGKIAMAHDPAPIGFRLDVGFGRTFNLIHSTDTAPRPFRGVEQGYLALAPKKAGGLEVDLGQFVTSAGAEVIEAFNNWNYSRSLLFAYALPYYHFGVRATKPLGKHFTGGLQLVNGWNSLGDTIHGNMAGVTGTYTTKYFSWSNNVYLGPPSRHAAGSRYLYDTTLLLNPAGRVNMYLNFDYGLDHALATGAARWLGIAGAAHIQLSKRFAFSPRLEWFNDANGFATGTAQQLKEGTLTGEFLIMEGLLTRLEYRHDWSNSPVFDRGAARGWYFNQPTVALGVVAFFGPRR